MKLAHLTEKFLGRRIQEGTHDSVADARATMELALLKFVFGVREETARERVAFTHSRTYLHSRTVFLNPPSLVDVISSLSFKLV